MIYFNHKRVVMAVAKQLEHQQLEADSIPAIRIFEWAKTQLEKTEELYHKRKSEIIKTTAERLESKGFPINKICIEIVKQLSDYVDDKYVYEILPSKYKDSKHQANALSRSENRAKAVVKTLVQQQQQHIECESCPEAYSIEKVRSGVYTYEYLQDLCIWLHETLEINCKGK